MTDGLREAVARAICASLSGLADKTGSALTSFDWRQHEDAADAAIALVLEEAARVIEQQRNDVPACGWEFAAAIRAMKGERR